MLKLTSSEEESARFDGFSDKTELLSSERGGFIAAAAAAPAMGGGISSE